MGILLRSGPQTCFHSGRERGGSPPYQWALIKGPLPPGLSLSPEGLIDGRPETGGSFEFAVGVTDGRSEAFQTLTLLVEAPQGMTILSGFLPEGSLGAAYKAQPQASGGTPPYRWILSGGTLPAGLKLGADGVLSGVPGESGKFGIMVQVADSSSGTDTRSLALLIQGEPVEPLGVFDELKGADQVEDAIPEGQLDAAYPRKAPFRSG